MPLCPLECLQYIYHGLTTHPKPAASWRTIEQNVAETAELMAVIFDVPQYLKVIMRITISLAAVLSAQPLESYAKWQPDNKNRKHVTCLYMHYYWTCRVVPKSKTECSPLFFIIISFLRKVAKNQIYHKSYLFRKNQLGPRNTSPSRYVWRGSGSGTASFVDICCWTLQRLFSPFDSIPQVHVRTWSLPAAAEDSEGNFSKPMSYPPWERCTSRCC